MTVIGSRSPTSLKHRSAVSREQVDALSQGFLHHGHSCTLSSSRSTEPQGREGEVDIDVLASTSSWIRERTSPPCRCQITTQQQLHNLSTSREFAAFERANLAAASHRAILKRLTVIGSLSLLVLSLCCALPRLSGEIQYWCYSKQPSAVVI